MRTLRGRKGLIFSSYHRDSVGLAGQLPRLRWVLSLSEGACCPSSPLSLPSCLLASFSLGCQFTHIRKEHLGMGSVWQEKSRMDLSAGPLPVPEHKSREPGWCSLPGKQ